MLTKIIETVLVLSSFGVIGSMIGLLGSSPKTERIFEIAAGVCAVVWILSTMSVFLISIWR